MVAEKGRGRNGMKKNNLTLAEGSENLPLSNMTGGQSSIGQMRIRGQKAAMLTWADVRRGGRVRNPNQEGETGVGEDLTLHPVET